MRRSATWIVIATLAASALGLLASPLLMGNGVPAASAPGSPVTKTAAGPEIAAPASFNDATTDGTAATPGAGAPRDAGGVIVSLKRTPTDAECAALGISPAPIVSGKLLFVAAAPVGVTATKFAATLSSSALVEYAEPDYLLEPAVNSYGSNPNDPDFRDASSWQFEIASGTTTISHAKSWALRGDGSANFNLVWPALAHDKAGHEDAPDVRVAVMDTGFYFAGHTDLGETGNIVAAVDECDGYWPDWPLASQLTTDTNVTPASSATTSNVSAPHGTMVASQIGQGTSNGVGSSGAAWDTRVDIYKIQGVTKGGTVDGPIVMPDSALVKAIYDAVDDAHAKSYRLVINLSLVEQAGSGGSISVRNAIAYARQPEHDVIVVAAAGNDGNSVVSYPAAYDGVIAVGASTLRDGDLSRASFSNYGTKLDILAPGEHIWGPIKPGTMPSLPGSTAPDPDGVVGYDWWDGTSMAAPYVSSAAALLLRLEPSLTAAEVESYLIRNTTEMGGPGRDNETGWGQLDAYRAYRDLATPKTTVVERAGYVQGDQITLSVTDRDSGVNVTTHYRIDGMPVDGAEGATATITFDPGPNDPHTFEYWSEDSNGVTEDVTDFVFEVREADLLSPITSSDVTRTYAGYASVQLSVYDPAPGWIGSRFPIATYYRLDAGATTAGSAVFVGSLGAHTLQSWSVDYAGNVGTATVAAFTVLAVPDPEGTPSTPLPVSTQSTNKTFAVAGSICWHKAGAEPVTLQFYRYESGHWVLRKSTYASASDTFTFSTYSDATSMPYSGTWRVRARHRVGSTYRYSGYKTFTVVATPPISGTPSTPSTASSVRHGTPFSVSGYVTRHAAATAPVKLYFYRYESRHWVLRTSAYATVSDYLTFSKYAGAASVPYAGKWRVKAAHADGFHTEVSGYRYFIAN